jgi:tRNA(Ile)-lysidine synthase
MLSISKADILEYCSVNNIKYVTDSTNTDTDYTRNRIRAKIIPELKAIAPGAENAAARLSDSLRADALCLDSMAEWFLSEMRDGYFIETEKLCGSPSAIVTRALMMMYAEISDGASLEYDHIKALMALAERSVPHSSLDLPLGIRAVIENRSLGFTRAQKPPKNHDLAPFSHTLSMGENRIDEIGALITLENEQKVYKKSMNLTIDFDKILGSLHARERRGGDKIRINGMSRSIKKLMCDKKIPLGLRPRIPVLCVGDEIVAVPYIGVSDSVKATKDTANAVSISFDIPQ